MTDTEILSRDFIIAQATDAAERAVRLRRSEPNNYPVDSEAWKLFRKTYDSQVLKFAAERMRAKRGETA